MYAFPLQLQANHESFITGQLDQALGLFPLLQILSLAHRTLLPEYPEVLVVENALEDIRFRNNPLVLGAPHIRFYAGCPLVAANKLRLGSLCIIDNKPRCFDAESCNMLTNMAEMVVREIEKDVMLEAQKAKSVQLHLENNQLIRALDCFK